MNKGFTLLELIVIIAITAVLMSIFVGAVPSLRSQTLLFQDKIKIVNALNQAKSLALSMYVLESDIEEEYKLKVCGYGLRLEPGNQKVIFYKDIKTETELTANPPIKCSDDNNHDVTYDRDEEKDSQRSFTFSQGIELIEGSQTYFSADIFFVPPSGKAKIKLNGAENWFSDFEIVLQSTTGNQAKIIINPNSGLITTE